MKSAVLAIFTPLISLGCLATLLFAQNIYEKKFPNPDQGIEELIAEGKTEIYNNTYKLEPLILNLSSSRSRLHYLDTQIFLVPFSRYGDQVYDRLRPQIYDIIINTITSLKPNEIETPSGKLMLEEKIRKKINKLATKPLVKEILFAKFIIQ